MTKLQCQASSKRNKLSSNKCVLHGKFCSGCPARHCMGGGDTLTSRHYPRSCGGKAWVAATCLPVATIEGAVREKHRWRRHAQQSPLSKELWGKSMVGGDMLSSYYYRRSCGGKAWVAATCLPVATKASVAATCLPVATIEGAVGQKHG